MLLILASACHLHESNGTDGTGRFAPIAQLARFPQSYARHTAIAVDFQNAGRAQGGAQATTAAYQGIYLQFAQVEPVNVCNRCSHNAPPSNVRETTSAFFMPYDSAY